jgi:hypothetical protein
LLINSAGTAAYAVGTHLTTNKAFIFRYNPTDTASTAPIWQKRWTYNPTPSDIVFGANENVIFAINASSATETLITLFEDASSPAGNWKWTRYFSSNYS